MKRLLFSLIAVATMMFAFSPAYAVDNTGLFGVGIDAGLTFPAGGNITTDTSFGDVFGSGPILGIHAKYGLTKEFSVEFGGRYTFMKMKDEMIDAMGIVDGEPHFSAMKFYVDGILNLGAFMNNPENKLNPFLRAGVGMVPWKVTEDGAGGDPIEVGTEELKKSSLALDFGLGVEYMATPNMGLFIDGRYNYIFSKDEDKFGEDFDNVAALDVVVGLTYFFGTAQ